ncbi:hypothetical protein G9F71_024930 [Clostridium sp. FP2]|uniref:hypothetical protein n=1 Tax=Clostridium sp. FP2 TaxID=2724481 RepID=UPI0016528E4F|nr:hypothetical protein [Clostridium sp. FP2]MBZ9626053.1 hypothetical protein [Clostridium sp. FP2]
MKLVQPIRDREKLEEMKMELLKTGYKNYLIFVVGINTGLRISDILANLDDKFQGLCSGF